MAQTPALSFRNISMQFPDGTKARLAIDQDPREVFANWLLNSKNPWFARNIAKRLDPSRQWRLIIGHCDCVEDAERVHAALLRQVRNIDRAWIMDVGVAIGAHAGPGSLVIGVQDYEPPQP